MASLHCRSTVTVTVLHACMHAEALHGQHQHGFGAAGDDRDRSAATAIGICSAGKRGFVRPLPAMFRSVPLREMEQLEC